ncbi:hypothetical protein P9112_013509 [Eukaryota sp. TZLM1-RC]
MSKPQEILKQTHPSVDLEQPLITKLNHTVDRTTKPQTKNTACFILFIGVVIAAMVFFVLIMSDEIPSDPSDPRTSFSISGSVFLEGQSVEADVVAGIEGSEKEKSTNTTNGHFDIILLANPDDIVEIAVSSPDQCFESLKITEVVSEAHNLSIGPKPASKEFEVSGTIYFDGSPSSNAWVSVKATEGSSAQRSQSTDSSGRFSLIVDGYCRSDFDVAVTATDDSFDDKLLTVSMDDRQNVDITVIKTYTVTGTLYLWDEPSDVVDVRLIDSANTTHQVKPNSNGHFTFSKVAKGPGEIGIYPYWKDMHYDIDVYEDMNHYNITVYESTQITMKVKQNGYSVAGAMIDFNGEDSLVTNSNGIIRRYVDIKHGASYTITVYGQRHMPLSTEFLIGDDPTIIFDLTPASIEFTHSGDVVAIDFAREYWYDSSSLHSEWSDVAFCEDGTIYWNNCGSSMNNVICVSHIHDLSFKLFPDWTSRNIEFTNQRHTIGGQECMEVRWDEEKTVHHFWCLTNENHNLKYERFKRSFFIWNSVEEVHFRDHVYHSRYSRYQNC